MSKHRWKYNKPIENRLRRIPIQYCPICGIGEKRSKYSTICYNCAVDIAYGYDLI